MQPRKHIEQLVQQYPDGQVIFDDPLEVQDVFTVCGVWSGDNGLFVLDGAGEWHGPLLTEQVNGELMINSIYQHLKAMPVPSVVLANYDNDINAIIFE